MKRSPALECALDAAQAASEISRRYFSEAGATGQLEVRVKQDRSPVTDADVESEQAIREILARTFPDHGFYGEETGGNDRSSDHVWLVDPIDGTKSFVRGYRFFSTQIALERKGQLVLGVSAAPLYGEIATAERGGGAFLDERPISVSSISELEQAHVSFGNIQTLVSGTRLAGFTEIVQRAHRTRGYGDFLHYHLLAAGCIDAVIESDVNILDIAALSVLVEEAGGRVTELNGGPIGRETSTVLATNGHLHEELLALLQPR